MKDPLCDAQALHADSMSSFREGSTHSSFCASQRPKHKASKRGGNAVEVTIGRGREQDAPVGGQLSCRYMGQKRDWRWPSFSTTMAPSGHLRVKVTVAGVCRCLVCGQVIATHHITHGNVIDFQIKKPHRNALQERLPAAEYTSLISKCSSRTIAGSSTHR
jgi:hypothetical protein